MKKISVLSVLALALVATVAVSLDIAEVLEQSLDSRGGSSAFQELETYRARGIMKLDGTNHGGMEIQAPFTLEWKRPNRVRLDFEIQGATGVRASDGDNAWMLAPMMGPGHPEALPDHQKSGLEDLGDFIEGPLVAPDKKGVEVAMAGMENLEGTDVYVLEVTRSDSRAITFLLDAETALPIQLRAKRQQEGVDGDLVRTLSDYKWVDGLLFPHFIETANEVGTVLQTYVIEEIEIGVDLEDARFSMPTQEGAAG